MKVSRRILALGVSVAVLVLGLTAWSAWPRESELPPCSVRTFEGSRFTVCVFDARRDELMFASRDAVSNASLRFSATTPRVCALP
jgi:hypothetical protein